LASIINADVTDVRLLSSGMLTQNILWLFNIILVVNLYIQNFFKFTVSNLTLDGKDAWKFCFPSDIRTATNFMATIVSFVYKSAVLLASYYTAPQSLNATASVSILLFYISNKISNDTNSAYIGRTLQNDKEYVNWRMTSFCDVTPCSLAVHRPLGLRYCLYLHTSSAFYLLIVGYLLGLFIDVENGGSRSPQNVGELLPDCTS
jgi:hypothetical protein